MKTLKRFSMLIILVVISCQPKSQLSPFIQGKVLFLGDSITHNGAYVSLINYELLKNYPD